MNLCELSDYCCSLPGVRTQESEHPGNIYRFLVDKKLFAYYKTSEPQRGRFSIRVDPERYWELTDQNNYLFKSYDPNNSYAPYPIQPARYMARFHWITLIEVNAIPEEWLQNWVLGSYHQAVSQLSKKRQREINSALSQLSLDTSL